MSINASSTASSAAYASSVVTKFEKFHGVGYGKPPKETQFKPGQSGNPAGRPKGTPNLRTAIQKVMRTKVRIRENGQTRTVAVSEAMIRRMAEMAMQGNTAAFNALAKLAERAGEKLQVKDLSPEEQRKINPIIELHLTDTPQPPKDGKDDK